MTSTVNLPQDREKIFEYFDQKDQAKETNGRDAKGRFAPGNGGGPGNPFGRRVGELRKAMLAAVNNDDIQDILRAMIDRAKEGHVQAAKLVLSYTIGKPTDTVDPDRADVDEWKVEADRSVAARDFNAALHGFPADVAKQMLDIVWPCMLHKHSQTLDQMHAESERTKQEIAELDRQLREEYERRRAEEPAKASEQPSANGENHGADVSPGQAVEPAEANEPRPVCAEATATSPSANGENRSANVSPAPSGGRAEANDQLPALPGGGGGDRPSANGDFYRAGMAVRQG